MPIRSASAVISSLSMPTSGRRISSVGRARQSSVMFSSVCDATWPMTSPVTSARACHLPREPLGDPQHQPPVDDDAQLGRHRRARPAAAARRTAPAPAASAADASSAARRSRAPSPATPATGSGSCESESAARSSRGASSGTPRPANRCRPTAGTRPGRRCRSAGRRRPAPCRRSRTRRPGSISMWIVSAGCSRSTRQPFASLISPPTSRSICGDVNGNRLSARRPLTRNDAGVADRRGRARMAAASASKSCGPRPACEKLAMPNTRRSALAHLVGHGAPRRRARSRSGPSPIGPRATSSPASARLQIADQHLDEPRAVLSLERQLLVVDDDRVHSLSGFNPHAEQPAIVAPRIDVGRPESVRDRDRQRRQPRVQAGRHLHDPLIVWIELQRLLPCGARERDMILNWTIPNQELKRRVRIRRDREFRLRPSANPRAARFHPRLTGQPEDQRRSEPGRTPCLAVLERLGQRLH